MSGERRRAPSVGISAETMEVYSSAQKFKDYKLFRLNYKTAGTNTIEVKNSLWHQSGFRGNYHP